MAKYRFDQIAINSTEKKKPVEEDRFTYLGLEHLDSGSLKVTRFGSEVAPIGEKLVMHKGDVLFGKRRAYQKKVAIAPFDGIFSAHGMVLRPKEDVIDKDFFPLFISSDYFLDAAIKISVGSLSPTINWRDLKELEFELPDMDTQRKLAEVLWSINDTMEAYKRLISATDELVKSQFIDMFGAPLSNEKGWSLKRIGDLFSLISRGKQPSYVDHSSVRVVNQACIYWDRFNFENVKYHDLQSGKKTLPVKKDCILINSTGTGTLGRCNVFPELTDGYVYVVDSHVTVLAESHDVNAYFFKRMTRPNGRFLRIPTKPSSTGKPSILCSASGMADAGSHRWAKCRYSPEWYSARTVATNSTRFGAETCRKRSTWYAPPTGRLRADAVPTRSETRFSSGCFLMGFRR